MSDTIRTVVSRQAGSGVFITYVVELTSDARAVVSSEIKRLEVHRTHGSLTLAPEEARRLAVTILGALDTIDPEAVVNR